MQLIGGESEEVCRVGAGASELRDQQGGVHELPREGEDELTQQDVRFIANPRELLEVPKQLPTKGDLGDPYLLRSDEQIRVAN